MSISYEKFVQSLTDAGLMSGAEIAAFLKSAGKNESFKDAKTLAKLLVAAGKLTRFQAQTLWEDNASSLLMGDYLILDKIGAGGMGQVYKAQHRRMKRIVAIKTLNRTAVQSETMVRRFFREVESAGKLTHPNIVTAYDAGEHQGELYMAMEFVDGKDLVGVLKERGPLPIDQAVNVILQTCAGLAYAHSQGVIHRDIKPANLLLNSDGTVKILDLGLARSTGEEDAHPADQSLTMAGKILGTVEYMSPEQAANPKLAGPPADIYSLGCTFYRLLTNQIPFSGSTPMETVIAHQTQPIPQLSDALGGSALQLLPLQQILEGMLAKRVEERFQTVEQAASELAKVAPNAIHATLSVSGAKQVTAFSLTGSAHPSAPGLSTPGRVSQVSRVESPASQKPPPSRMPAYAGIAAAVILLVGVAAWMLKDPRSHPPIATQTHNQLQPPAAPAPMPNSLVASPQDRPAPSHQVRPDPGMAGESLDILPLTDPARDAVAGSWAMQNGEMTMTEGALYSRIRLPVAPPEAYKLEFNVKGQANQSGVTVGLVGPGCQFRAVIAGYGENHASGLGQLNGKPPGGNETRNDSFSFVQGREYHIACVVKPGRVQIDVDGVKLIHWQGDMASLSAMPAHNVGDPRKLFLSVGEPGWFFSNLKITSLDGSKIAVDAPAEPLTRLSLSAQTLWQTSVQLEAGKPFDLMPKILADRLMLNGEWKFIDGAAICPPTHDAALMLPVRCPERYRLDLEVTRLSGSDAFYIRLAQANSKFLVDIDGFGDRHLTSLDSIEGLRPNNPRFPAKPYAGFQFQTGATHQLACIVDSNRVIVEIDGKEIHRFEGDLSRLSGTASWMNFRNPRFPVIGAWSGEFRISKAVITELATPAAQPLTLAGDPIDLLPLIDLARDAKGGKWSLVDGKPASAPRSSNNRVMIPVTPPAYYRLESTITKLDDTLQSANFGLIFGGRRCLVILDGYTTSHTSGITVADGAIANSNVAGKTGLIMQKGRSYQVSCDVLPEGIRVRVDGKTIIEWNGQATQLDDGGEGWALPDATKLFFGSMDSMFRFDKLMITPLLPAPAPVTPGIAASSTPVQEQATPSASNATWTNLLERVDVKLDATAGKWQRLPEGLQVDTGKACRLALPASPAGSYELKLQFKRIEGSMLGVHLPVNDQSLLLSLGQVISGKPLVGIGNIDGKSPVALNNPTRDELQSLDNDSVHTLDIRVIAESESLLIAVTLDGQKVVEWNGPAKAVATNKEYAPKDPRRLGLAANASKVQFTDIQFRMLQGEANLLPRQVAGTMKTEPAPSTPVKQFFKIPGPAPQLLRLSRNQRVDLLKAALPMKDGKWIQAPGNLAVDGRGLTDYTWTRFPIRPTGSYEVYVTLQNLKDPDGQCRILFPMGPKGYVAWIVTPTISGHIASDGKESLYNRYVTLPSGDKLVLKFNAEPGIQTGKLTLTLVNTGATHPMNFTPEQLIAYDADTTMALGVQGQRISVREFRVMSLIE